MMIGRFSAATFLLAGLSISTIATAQSRSAAQDDSEGGEIVVTATGISSATSTNKSDIPVIESPQTVSIISREEIDLRASPTIADALSYTAGVFVEPYGGDSRTDEVAIRGFGASGFTSNNQFVDGLRMPAGGQWTRPGFDPFALQQLEVLKGPSGALYGQTAPGGVVNIVTKRPTFTPRGEVLMQGVGFNELGRWNHQGAADISGPVADNLALRAVGMVRYGGSQVQDTNLGRYYGSLSATWQATPSTTWTVLGQYQRDEGQSAFQFMPRLGALVATTGGFIENDANLGEPGWNQFDRDQYLLASFFEHRFGDAVTIRNNTRYTRLETLYRGVLLATDTLATTAACGTIAGCIPGRTVQRRALQGVGDSDGIATDTQVEVKIATGPVNHTLLAGFDYLHTDWTHRRDGVAAAQVLPILDILNPVPRGSAGYATNLVPAIYLDTITKQRGIYLQDQLALGGLRVTVGGRWDKAEDDTTNFTNAVRPVNYRIKSSAFTWRAGAVYLFDNGLAPYASYAESFQPQVSDPSTSLGGVQFVPVTGQQYEAGLRFQSGRNIYVTLGGYQITQQNITTPDPAGTPCGTGICLVQTGEGRVRGIELEGRASLPFGLAVIAAATHAKSEVTQSNIQFRGADGQLRSLVGNALPTYPEWLGSLFLDQRIKTGPLAGLGLGGGARYVGEHWGDTNNTLRIPDYTQFDLFLRYDFGAANPELQGLTASINGRNIADKRFVSTCGSAVGCYYGQGRSITARLDFRW